MIYEKCNAQWGNAQSRKTYYPPLSVLFLCSYKVFSKTGITLSSVLTIQIVTLKPLP